LLKQRLDGRIQVSERRLQLIDHHSGLGLRFELLCSRIRRFRAERLAGTPQTMSQLGSSLSVALGHGLAKIRHCGRHILQEQIHEFEQKLGIAIHRFE
jgi:hypothetical protein